MCVVFGIGDYELVWMVIGYSMVMGLYVNFGFFFFCLESCLVEYCICKIILMYVSVWNCLIVWYDLCMLMLWFDIVDYSLLLEEVVFEMVRICGCKDLLMMIMMMMMVMKKRSIRWRRRRRRSCCFIIWSGGEVGFFFIFEMEIWIFCMVCVGRMYKC